MKQKEGILNDPACKNCHGLWREYASATAEHIGLDSKLKLAALSHDDEAIQTLTPQVERAKEERVRAREAIRQHEAATHSIGDAPVIGPEPQMGD